MATISISMRQMLEAGVHFGHRTRFWNPEMAPYIYGERESLHIINLETSLPKFRELLEAAARITSKRGKVMFVGTKHAASDVVKEEAIRCGMPYVERRWLGGMLTNYKTIRQSIKRLKELEEMLENTKALAARTKKEVITLQREKDKLASNLDGIKNMGGLPDMLFVIDVKQEKTAISEAKRLSIPVAAIVDTNASPKGIDYVVPGNDDAISAIRFYCKTLADVIIESRRIILEEDAEAAKAKATKAKQKPVASEATIIKKTKQKPSAQKPNVSESAQKPSTQKPNVSEGAKRKTSAKKKPSVSESAAQKPNVSEGAVESSEE